MCLPKPITVILRRPLSISPAKFVCGFTRFTVATWSASKDVWSKWMGTPSVAPRSTVSIEGRMGTPTPSSVMP